MPGSTAIPCLRYRDAPTAIGWLGRAFGFAPQLVVPDGTGGVAHAQLVCGSGMVMLGSVRDGAYGRLMKQPDETGGASTQSVYVVVADADAIHARAVGAGAEIVIPLKDEAHGGRGFTCRDPEGHVWSIGTYDPWAQPG
jgi:uncharacterized glyoxalase superfamily protein PhnB